MATTVLCADDEEYMRVFYKSVFSGRDYELHVFDNGNDVLDHCRDTAPGLLILDIDMPGATGLDVCRRARADSRLSNIPIVIVSARDTESDIVDALSIGADDYIVKPFKPAELLAKSTAILRKRRSDPIVDSATIREGSFFAGRYRIIRQLGRGGFGKVYLAEDSSCDDSNVALKVFEIPVHVENFMALFLREAYGLSKLRHKNIVRLLGFGHAHSRYYLSTEFLEGMSLADIIRKKGAMLDDNAAYIAYETAQALEYMADRKMVHCDIKPDNIMIAKTGDLKVIDFGMAKQLLDVNLTPEDMFVGTPEFIAPELICDDTDIDIRADVFSLGVTLYALIAGRTLFAGISPEQVLRSRMANPTIKLDFDGVEVDTRLRDLLIRMVVSDPNERPNVHEVVQRLRDIVSST